MAPRAGRCRSRPRGPGNRRSSSSGGRFRGPMAPRPGVRCSMPRGGRCRLRRPRNPSGRPCRGAGAPRALPASPP
eukprot:10869237-Alexandrium_andersonii.AAC.1